MSGRTKMIQIGPITFHGMSSGKATKTSDTDTPQPRAGITSAIATPSGISMSRTSPEKMSCRLSASCRRESCSTSSNHSVPTKTRWPGPKMSWTE